MATATAIAAIAADGDGEAAYFLFFLVFFPADCRVMKQRKERGREEGVFCWVGWVGGAVVGVAVAVGAMSAAARAASQSFPCILMEHK